MVHWQEMLTTPKMARAVSQYSIEYVMRFFMKGRILVGNDFDAALVLFAVQVHVGQKAFRTNESGVRTMAFSERFPDELLVPVTRADLAAITGFSLQIIRRKVEKLEKLGLIRRVGRHGIAISHEFAASPERAELMAFNHRALFKMLGQFDELQKGG